MSTACACQGRLQAWPSGFVDHGPKQCSSYVLVSQEIRARCRDCQFAPQVHDGWIVSEPAATGERSA